MFQHQKIPVGTNQNNNQTAREALKEAFSNKSYIYLTLGFFVCGWHIALVATHIPTYMIDKGLPDWCAAMVLALIGLFNMVGTITSGYLATRYSQKILLSAIYLLRGCLLYTSPSPRDYPGSRMPSSA